MQNSNIINNATNPINIIAIDGTTASGKGSLARKMAESLGYNYLNSGALYRLTAYTLKQKDFDFEKYNILRKERELPHYIENPEYIDMENMVADAGASLRPTFLGKQVLVDNIDVWPIISTQEYGNYAARISPTLHLREALYLYQRSCIEAPGLVAEGRDMTSEVYTDAVCKIYLDATPECRAERRLREELLEDTGKNKTLDIVLAEIHDRDTKDKNRHHSPLTLTPDSYYLDTTETTVEEALAKALEYFKTKIS